MLSWLFTKKAKPIEPPEPSIFETEGPHEDIFLDLGNLENTEFQIKQAYFKFIHAITDGPSPDDLAFIKYVKKGDRARFLIYRKDGITEWRDDTLIVILKEIPFYSSDQLQRAIDIFSKPTIFDPERAIADAINKEVRWRAIVLDSKMLLKKQENA